MSSLFCSLLSCFFPTVPSPSSLRSLHRSPCHFLSLYSPCFLSLKPSLLCLPASTIIPQNSLNFQHLLVVLIFLAHLFPSRSFLHPSSSLVHSFSPPSLHPSAGILEKEVTHSDHFLLPPVLLPFISLFPSLHTCVVLLGEGSNNGGEKERGRAVRLLSCRESEESIGTEICGARKRYCIGYNKHSRDIFGKRSPSCTFTCAREHTCIQPLTYTHTHAITPCL